MSSAPMPTQETTEDAAPWEWRTGADRRQRPTPLINKHFLRGGRRGPRRTTDPEQCYIDRPPLPWVLLTTGLVLTSAVDLWLTNLGVAAGFYEEANPIMRWFFENLGTPGAWGFKSLVTVVGAYILLAHCRWRVGRAGMYVLAASYGALTVWHVVALTIVGRV